MKACFYIYFLGISLSYKEGHQNSDFLIWTPQIYEIILIAVCSSLGKKI